MSEFSQLLLDSLSSEGNRRNVAETKLSQLREQNFPLYLFNLAEEVANEDRPADLRQMAALTCKNAVAGYSDQTKEEHAAKWLQLPKDQRNAIKAKFLQSLSSPQQGARSGAAQVIAQFGCIEIPTNEWPELIETLLANVNTGNNFAKQATLETLGIICEEIHPGYLTSQSNTILNTIVSGLAPGLPVEISKAAINALLGSLAFIKSNFENLDHRNYIMKVICEATQFDNRDIQYIAMQCLVRIADNYYDHILAYIDAIFKITTAFIISPHDEIAQQAVEFWSTICEKEIDRFEDLSFEKLTKKLKSGEQGVVFHYIIKTVIPHLFPALTVALSKQSEDAEVTWNVSTCAVACITLISQTIEDDFIPILLPFVQANLKSPDWRAREAATIILGSVLEFCQADSTAEILKSALPVFIDHMKTDPSLKVKDTTAWTLAKAAEFHPNIIFENGNIVPVLETLVMSLNSEANVASQACYALLNVIQLFPSVQTASSSLSGIFSPLLEALIRASERPDADEFNLRITAYESINALVTNAPDDVKPTIYKLVELLIDRISKTFFMENVDLEEKVEFQNYLCSVLQTIITKLRGEIAQYAQPLMEIFFRVLDFVPNQLPPEAIMAVSSLLAEIPSLIQNYLEPLKRYTIISLTNYEETSVFISGLSLLGTICGQMEVHFYTMDNGQFCDKVVELLITSLPSQKLSNSVKPTILNSFGEIASAIQEHSVKYLQRVMGVLISASKTTVNDDDEDEVEYLISLRESILETYTMFIQSLKDPQARNHITPFIPDILNFVNVIWNDEQNRNEALVGAIIGIIGDISVAFGEGVRGIMTQPVVQVIISKGLSSRNAQIQRTARWAQSVIPK